MLRLKLARQQGKLRAAARKGSTAKAKAEARQAAGPSLRSATRAPGVAARWRVSFVAARQAVRHFNADRQPLGAVMLSIASTAASRTSVRQAHGSSQKNSR